MNILETKVEELHSEGLNVEEIAGQLNRSVELVEEILEQLDAEFNEGNTEEVETIETIPEDTSIPLEQSLSGLSGIEKSNELKEKELLILEKKAQIEKEKSKRQILKKIKALSDGIREHVNGSIWEIVDVRKISTELNDVEEEVSEHLEFDRNTMKSNSIIQILNILQTEFNNISQILKDNDYTVNITWSDEKIGILDSLSLIENTLDSGFDSASYHAQRAKGGIHRLIDSMLNRNNTKVDMEAVGELINELNQVRNLLESGLPGLDQFNKELDLIISIDEYLKELQIRIDESIWSEKRLQLSEEIITEIDEISVEEKVTTIII